MDVPSAVLQKLVCERCSGYLSSGPVHLLEIGKYLCGRCVPSEEEDATRIEAYEELAKLMLFPCRYHENGCRRKVPFTDNERHEQACPYRDYLCPIAESGQCEWTGIQTGILEHCQQDHPTNVVENPCNLIHDITQPSLNNYMLFAFGVLFLIQSKVCTATRNIYHAVRLIGNPARASDFKYTLEIQNKDRQIRSRGDVLPRELLFLQEDTSVVTDINSVLGYLGNFEDTTFTVTIECSDQGTNRMCKEHAPEQSTCKYSIKGCTYSDFTMKCKKHEVYHCQFSNCCLICVKFIDTTLDEHYNQAHGAVTHRAGTVCTLSPVLTETRLVIVCDFGRAMCGYELTNSYFQLWMSTPLPSAQLYKYRCSVELSHPNTGHTLTRTLTVQYDIWNSSYEDWVVRIPRSDYNAYAHDNEMNMKINITKIDDPSQFMV